MPDAGAVRFGPFEVRLATRELRKLGVKVRLGEKPFQLLAVLLERPGEAVSREELRRRIWPDVHVEFENSLNSAANRLRDALCDAASTPRYIETVPRLGYRFIGALERPVPVPPARRARAWPVLALVAVWLAAGWASGRIPAASPAAQAACREARYLREKQDLAGALQRLEPALAEPGFAAAAALEADLLASLALAGQRDPALTWPRARAAVDRALRFDPRNAVAWRVRATIVLHAGWDPRRARAAAERATRLDPASGEAWMTAATVASALGEHERAIAHARRAAAADPESWQLRSDLAYFYLAAGRWREAEREARSALRLDPAFRPAAQFLLDALVGQGNWAEAHRFLSSRLAASQPASPLLGRLQRLAPEAALRHYWEHHLTALGEDPRAALAIAGLHARLGRPDQALAWLERAWERRDGYVVLAGALPDFAALRGDPRLASLLRRAPARF